MLHGGSKAGWKQLGRLLSVIWVRLGSDPSGKYHHQYSHSETTTSTSEDFRAGNVQPQGSFRFRLGELPRGDRGAHGSRLHSSGRDPQSQFRSDRSRSSERQGHWKWSSQSHVCGSSKSQTQEQLRQTFQMSLRFILGCRWRLLQHQITSFREKRKKTTNNYLQQHKYDKYFLIHSLYLRQLTRQQEMSKVGRRKMTRRRQRSTKSSLNVWHKK